MGIAEAFGKQKNEQKSRPTAPQGHTLIEVLNDKHKSHLFGKLLEKEGGHEDLITRLAEGKLEADDIKVLEEKRQNLSEKITAAEEIEKLLTTESILGFARNHDEFKTIISLVGPEKAAKVIKDQLAEMSITDPFRFDSIAFEVKTREDYKKGKYKEINDKVEALCKDNGIKPKEYLDALALSDPEKTEALKELAKKYGGRWFGRLNKDLLKELEKSETSLEESYTELEKYNEYIGLTLFLSISNNDTVRKALSNELAGHKNEKEKKTGFGDAKKGVEDFKEENFNKDWEEAKKKTKFSTRSPLEQDIIKDEFLEHQMEKYEDNNEGNDGFWISIFSALFERKLKDKKATLK